MADTATVTDGGAPHGWIVSVRAEDGRSNQFRVSGADEAEAKTVALKQFQAMPAEKPEADKKPAAKTLVAQVGTTAATTKAG